MTGPAPRWLAVLLLGACRLAPDDPWQTVPERSILEAETATLVDAEVVPGLLASERRAVRARANGGRVALALTWPQPPDPGTVESGRLWLRASCLTPDSLTLPVWLDGRHCGAVTVADTWHRDRFEWFPLDVGDVAAGVHEVVIELPPADLWLDQVAMWPVDRELPVVASPAVYRESDAEIRADCTATVFDVEWVFRLMRRHRAFVARTLGFDLRGPAVLAVLDDAHWPDPATGAFQSRGIVYLKASELHLSWVNYTHEFVHVFQAETPVDTPLFFTEGVAFLVAQLAELGLYERTDAVARRVVPLKRALNRPIESGDVADVFRWGSPEFGAASVRQAYRRASAMLWRLHEQHGAGWLKVLYRELEEADHPRVQALEAAGSPDQRARALVEMISAATGQDLSDQFEVWGLPATGTRS